MAAEFEIVQLANGAHTVRSHACQETFHPVVGPVAEAESLYVHQLSLVSRFESHPGEFVVWDVGLGAAGNPATVLRALGGCQGSIRLESFDLSIDPLAFALNHLDELAYLRGLAGRAEELLGTGKTNFREGRLHVDWRLHLGNFPSLLDSPRAAQLAKPHVIMFDPFSPVKNPEMWTLSLFSKLHRVLDPGRPCALATYSRSTMLRATLLLARFFVGSGSSTGEKEETTIAATALELISRPLDQAWLRRARRSTSAEPLHEPRYRQAPLSPDSWVRLQEHPQFRG